MVPKGRDEDHLSFAMEWVRYHDRYDTNGTDEFADADKPYWPETASASSCGLRLWSKGDARVNAR